MSIQKRTPGKTSLRSWPGILWFVVVMLIASPCLGYPRMGPAMDRDIARLVYTNSTSYPLPEGWEIQSRSFTDTDITVTLKSETGDEAVVRLSYPWLPVRGEIVGRTLSFRLEILTAEGAEARTAALDFCNRIRKNDRVYFFASKNMLKRELWTQYLFRRFIFTPIIDYKLLFVICPLLGLYMMKSSIVRKYFLPEGAYGRLALLAVFVLGLTLRLYVSPSVPIHCNSHGIGEVRLYLSLMQDETLETAYGRAFPSIMRWILGFIGPVEKNIFLINKILGALAIPAIFLFAKGLTGSDAAGIFSAFFLSLSPAQVWMAGTESQIPMYMLIGLTGLGLLCLSARTRSISILWLAAIMISYASSLRILTVLIVPVAVATGLYLGVHKKKDIHDTYLKHVIVCLAVAAIWMTFHYLSISAMTGKGWSESNPLKVLCIFFFHDGLSFKNTILDPTLTPFIVPFAAAAAYVYAWKRDRRFALFATVVFLIAVPMTFSVLDCRTSAVRYQTQAHWVYFILAASLFTSIAPEYLRRKRKTLAVLVIILTVVGSVPGLAMLYRGDEEMNEYRFMRETAHKIPAGTVIRLPVENAGNGKLITDFPDYINSHIVVKDREKAPDGYRELIYDGLDCYRFTTVEERATDFLPDGKNKQCVEICDGRLVPLYEKKLDAGVPFIGYHKRFYKLSTKKPVVGFYECLPDGK